MNVFSNNFAICVLNNFKEFFFILNSLKFKKELSVKIYDLNKLNLFVDLKFLLLYKFINFFKLNKFINIFKKSNNEDFNEKIFYYINNEIKKKYI